MQIVSLQAGSVVVSLRLTVWDPEFPLGVATLAPMLPPLWASTVFQVDQQGTLVQGGSSSHTRHHTLQSPGCGVSGQHPLFQKMDKVRELGVLILCSSGEGVQGRHPQTASPPVPTSGSPREKRPPELGDTYSLGKCLLAASDPEPIQGGPGLEGA